MSTTLLPGRRRYRDALRGNRSLAGEEVDLLFANPILTVRYVQSQLSLSQPGATNLLRLLVQQGVLREVGQGPGVRRRCFADDVFAVLDPERNS